MIKAAPKTKEVIVSQCFNATPPLPYNHNSSANQLSNFSNVSSPKLRSVTPEPEVCFAQDRFCGSCTSSIILHRFIRRKDNDLFTYVRYQANLVKFKSVKSITKRSSTA